MTYYYLIASLPAVALDAAPSLSWEGFLRRCDELLSPDDRRAVDELAAPIDAPSVQPFIGRWRQSEIRVRNAVAKTRAARLRRDAAPHLRTQEGFDLRTVHAVTDAFSKDNPREREAALDRLRWVLAEEAAGGDLFGIDALLAYAVKLKLAERWAKFDRDAGRRRVERLINMKSEA